MSMPEKKPDWKLIAELCKIQCTRQEIYATVNITDKTIDKHCKIDHGMSFSEFYEQNREGGRSSLRRSQWKMAQNTPSLSIWLGKQYLGQRDQQQHEVNVQPVTIKYDLDEEEELPTPPPPPTQH